MANLGSAALGQSMISNQSAAAASGQKKKSSNFAASLKVEMQFVRDESKKSQKYLQLLEQQAFVVES